MKPGDVLFMHVKEIGIEIQVGFSFNENRLDWAKDHMLPHTINNFLNINFWMFLGPKAAPMNLNDAFEACIEQR